MLAELDRLKVRSELLNKEIEFLAQPVTKLTTEELALFRQPVVSISNEQAGGLKMSFVFEKKSTADAGKLNATATVAPNALPSELQDVAIAAQKNLRQRKYRTAEKQYQTILEKDPNNLDALSNLGVVYFRTGKIGTAESTLKKALAIAPNDDFVLTTLGIVHYRQSRFDDALGELRKAIEINPNSATAHNYLGITASQKGRQQEAEKEMLQAIAKDPNYVRARIELYSALLLLSSSFEAPPADTDSRLRAAITNLMKIAPNVAEGQVAAANLASMDGRREEALARAERATRLPQAVQGIRVGIEPLDLIGEICFSLVTQPSGKIVLAGFQRRLGVE